MTTTNKAATNKTRSFSRNNEIALSPKYRMFSNQQQTQQPHGPRKTTSVPTTSANQSNNGQILQVINKNYDTLSSGVGQ
jgi:hypothetical protein